METCSGPEKDGRGVAPHGEHMVFDHKRRLEVSGWSIWGMKKTRFNSTDYGTIVLSSYAAAHT